MTGANGAPSETRTYNSLYQMTQLQSGGLNIQYNYSATANNGKITSQTDVVSGEQIAYTYDSLNRLASATSSVNPGWGQSYGYDGFGNLTTQTVTKGTAPSLSVSYDPATNRRTGECADANGNIYPSGCVLADSYDIENRLVRNGGYLAWAYSYAPGNKRVWRGQWDTNGTQTTDEITYWSATGQKLVTYSLGVYGTQLVATATGTNQYFGGKLVKNIGGYVTPDRLGSIGKYFPYGQERPSATTDGKEKFATYFRDSETGLDYANARYHQPGMGRFMSPDPYKASAGPKDPGSWNRYAYVGGDPVNYNDPHGTEACFLSVRGCETVSTGYGHGDLNACDPQVGYALAVNAYNDPYSSIIFDQYMMATSNCFAFEPEPEPEPPPDKPCDMEMFSRPVNDVFVASHQYLMVHDRNGNEWTLEGGHNETQSGIRGSYKKMLWKTGMVCQVTIRRRTSTSEVFWMYPATPSTL